MFSSKFESRYPNNKDQQSIEVKQLGKIKKEEKNRYWQKDRQTKRKETRRKSICNKRENKNKNWGEINSFVIRFLKL